MPVLLDTSFLYALNDGDDQNFQRAATSLEQLVDPLLLPSPVLPELCYLLHSRLGHLAMRRFLSGLASSDIQLATIQTGDLIRIDTLLDTYADAALDFTDAAIVTLAERLNITQVATFDRRDFTLIRPRHCAAFELLP